MTALPTGIGAVAVAAMIAADARDARAPKAAAKIVAATAFLVQAYGNGALGHGVGRLVFAGLALSWLGDVLLISRDKRPFLAGIGAFLLAHVVYVGAFATLGVSVPGAAVGLVALGAGTALLARRFVPKAGPLAPAVAAYIGVITVMGAAAVGCAAAEPTPARLVGAVAAVLFMASDICVARDRFEGAGFLNRATGWVMYFTAQFAFTWTIARP